MDIKYFARPKKNQGNGGTSIAYYGNSQNADNQQVIQNIKEKDPIFTNSPANNFTEIMLQVLKRLGIKQESVLTGSDNGNDIFTSFDSLLVNANTDFTNHDVKGIKNLDASFIKSEQLDSSVINSSLIKTKELDSSLINSTNINNTDTITTKNLNVTGSAHFWELVIDKIRSVGGSVIFTPADSFVIEDIEEIEYDHEVYRSKIALHGGIDKVGTSIDKPYDEPGPITPITPPGGDTPGGGGDTPVLTNNKIYYTAPQQLNIDTTGFTSHTYDTTTKQGVLTANKTITEIPEALFKDQYELLSVTIPESVLTIKAQAFMYCEKLRSITIPNTVKTIEHGAFMHCIDLINITIPESVTTLEQSSLDTLSACGYVNFGNVRTTLPNMDIHTFHHSLGDENHIYDEKIYPIIVPDACYNEARQIFTDEPKIVNRIVKYSDYFGNENPSNVNNRFYYKATKKLQFDNFDNTKITNHIYNTETKHGLFSLNGAGDPQLFAENLDLQEVVIPPISSLIGQSICFGCTNLTTVSLPPTITTIMSMAFIGCEKLNNINFPYSLQYFYAASFSECSNFLYFTLPGQTKFIGAEAFANCSNLMRVRIPNTVTTIHADAFEGCTNLTEIYYSGALGGFPWGATNAQRYDN